MATDVQESCISFRMQKWVLCECTDIDLSYPVLTRD